MLPFALASGVLGAYQTIKSMSELNNMGDREQFKIDPETDNFINRLKERSKIGISGDQRASMFNDIARGENTSFNRGVNVGGNQQAGVIQAAINADNGGRYKVGLADEQARDNHLRELSPWIQYRQSLLDRITADKQKQWDEQATQYGKAMESGLNNIAGTFNLNQALGYNPGGTSTTDSPLPTAPARLGNPNAVPSSTASYSNTPTDWINNPYGTGSVSDLNPGVSGMKRLPEDGIPYNTDWTKLWSSIK